MQFRLLQRTGFGKTDVKTQPYPGYPTDMQPQIAVALSLAKGTSIVTESIFRIVLSANELARMGAVVKVEEIQPLSTAWRI